MNKLKRKGDFFGEGEERQEEYSRAAPRSSGGYVSMSSSSTINSSVELLGSDEEATRRAAAVRSSYTRFSLYTQGKEKERCPTLSVDIIAHKIERLWSLMTSEEKSEWEPRPHLNISSSTAGTKQARLESSPSNVRLLHNQNNAGFEKHNCYQQERNKGKDSVEYNPNDQPKLPLSAYTFFSKKLRPIMKAAHANLPGLEITKRMGVQWRQMSTEEREPYSKMEREGRARYGKEMRLHLKAVSRCKEDTNRSENHHKYPPNEHYPLRCEEEGATSRTGPTLRGSMIVPSVPALVNYQQQPYPTLDALPYQEQPRQYLYSPPDNYFFHPSSAPRDEMMLAASLQQEEGRRLRLLSLLRLRTAITTAGPPKKSRISSHYQHNETT
jgi:hypothetical protein